VSPLDPEIPPAGEEIHLPGPSVLPALTALGITLALVGVTTYIELVVAGGLITLFAVIRWIRETREEVDELPLDSAEH
jgi:TRAP-type C4-dicarboxylate transport system permease small subunit